MRCKQFISCPSLGTPCNWTWKKSPGLVLLISVVALAAISALIIYKKFPENFTALKNTLQQNKEVTAFLGTGLLLLIFATDRIIMTTRKKELAPTGLKADSEDDEAPQTTPPSLARGSLSEQKSEDGELRSPTPTTSGETEGITQPKKSDYKHILSNDELAAITFMTTTTSEAGMLALAWKGRELEVKGELISHIHPLLFWKTILSDKTLSEKAKNIKNKRDVDIPSWAVSIAEKFVSGLKASIWKTFKFRYQARFEEQTNGTFGKEISGDDIQSFCADLNLSETTTATITKLINNKNWEGLIDNFIDISCPSKKEE